LPARAGRVRRCWVACAARGRAGAWPHPAVRVQPPFRRSLVLRRSPRSHRGLCGVHLPHPPRRPPRAPGSVLVRNEDGIYRPGPRRLYGTWRSSSSVRLARRWNSSRRASARIASHAVRAPERRAVGNAADPAGPSANRYPSLVLARRASACGAQRPPLEPVRGAIDSCGPHRIASACASVVPHETLEALEVRRGASAAVLRSSRCPQRGLTPMSRGTALPGRTCAFV